MPLAEEGLVNGKITTLILEKYIKPLKNKGIDTLVLGCTHYPLLKNAIKKMAGPKIKIINPAESLAQKIKKYLSENIDLSGKMAKGDINQFFFSDQPYNLDKISHLCFKEKIKPIVNDPFNV